jgi:hypothetical protein
MSSPATYNLHEGITSSLRSLKYLTISENFYDEMLFRLHARRPAALKITRGFLVLGAMRLTHIHPGGHPGGSSYIISDQHSLPGQSIPLLSMLECFAKLLLSPLQLLWWNAKALVQTMLTISIKD